MQKKYLFFHKGRLGYSQAGCRALVAMQKGEIKRFFSADNVSELYSLLEKNYRQMEHYNALQGRREEMLLSYTDDDCFSMSHMPAEEVPRPQEEAALQRAKELFLSPELQEEVISSGEKILTDSLVWWGKRITQRWCETFGRQPDIFCTDLQAKIKA